MHIPFSMKISNFRPKAFTLVEMVVVVGVILIILGLVLPAFSKMWNDAQVRNSHQKIESLLRVARARSLDLHYIAYGVLFYVDPTHNHQVAVFIDALPYPVAPDEVWPDVCDRFVVDTNDGNLFSMSDFVRISPFEALEWEDTDLLNNDYRTGKQRNFFAIIFQRGSRARPNSYILYDVDKDDDGLGDTLHLPVGDIVGDFGGVLRDIVLDENDKRRTIPTDWGFLIYNENSFNELRPDNLNLIEYFSYYLTRYGDTMALEKGMMKE